MSRRPELLLLALLSACFAVILPLAVQPACAQEAVSAQEAGGAEMAAVSPAVAEEQGQRLLHAARRGDVAAAQAALAAGASTRAVDSQGATALHHATVAAKPELVELLVAAGAAVGATATDGTTPLHWAARASGNATGRQVAERLLDSGAELEALDQLEQAPLHAAAFEGDPPLVELLLERGAQVDRADRRGNTPLLQAVGGALRIDRFALSYGSESLASVGQQAVIEQLLSRGADVNVRAEDGATALHRTARYGHLVLTRLLLAAGADPSARASDGKTPRDAALVERQQAVADLLAEAAESR